MDPAFANSRRARSAFTRLELLVMAGTVSLLILTLLPALARTRSEPQGTQCLYNLRQITLGWMMYANENNGQLTPNHGIFPANPDYPTTNPVWVAGMMDYTGDNQTIPGILDSTNSALLVNPARSELGPYVRNPSLYHCPSDQSQAYGLTGGARVRSYAMNGAVGSTANGTLVDGTHVAGYFLSSGNSTPPGGAPYRVYLKDSDFTGSQSPAGLFVLGDEDPDTLSSGTFHVMMPPSPAATAFIDMPAKYHNNAANFSFADGHVETHAWQLPQYIPAPMFITGGIKQTSLVPQNPDVLWLASHTSTLAPP